MFIDEEAEVKEKNQVDCEDEDREGETIKLMEIEEEKISKVFINDDHEVEEEEEVDINLYRILENSRILNDETMSIESDSICDTNNAIPDDEIIELKDITVLPVEVQDQIKKVLEAEDVESKEAKSLDDMNMFMTEKQKDKFKANIKKGLVKSGDKDGNCTFYSIINALQYIKTGVARQIKDEDDLALSSLIGREVLDILKEYKDRLRYCRQSDSIKHLIRLNEELKEVNITINLFKLKDTCKYLYSNWSKTKNRILSSKVKKIPVSMVETLLLGADRVKTFSEIRTNTEKDTIVNLVGESSRKVGSEVDISFIKDISALVKLVTTYRSKKTIDKTFICDQCMTVQGNKKLFNSHIKYCTEINSIKYNFNNDKIICFNSIQKSLPHPFTIYYDLETTAGQDNEGMRTISYVYSLAFNEEIRNRFEELKNVYEYRCMNQTLSELSTYHLPECIMRFVDKTDLTILSNSIKNINNNVPNSMERHCALEIYMVIKRSKKMLKVMVSTNCQLSHHHIKKYRSNNPIKLNEKCVICDIKSSTPGRLNKDLVKSIGREEFIRIYSNVGLFNMPEEEYLSNCVKVLENVILLADLPKINRSTGGDINIIKERFYNFYQFLSKHEVEDVQVLIDKVKDDYKEGLTGSDEDFGIKSKKERENIEEKIKKMMWKDALINYSYKSLIGVNIQVSRIWIQKVASLLEDELVIHHCHYSGQIYGYAHKNCNSKLRIQNEIPVKVYARNASNFDLLFLVKGFKIVRLWLRQNKHYWHSKSC